MGSVTKPELGEAIAAVPRRVKWHPGRRAACFDCGRLRQTGFNQNRFPGTESMRILASARAFARWRSRFPRRPSRRAIPRSRPRAPSTSSPRAEKEVYDVSTSSSSRVEWVNATYITDDTDALAAAMARSAPKCRSATRSKRRKYAKVPGLDPVVARKLNILRSGDRAARADHAGRGAGRCRHHRDRPRSRNTARARARCDGKPINGSDIEAEMGDLDRNAGRAHGDVDELARQRRRADAATTTRAWSRSPTQGAKELGYRRHRRDVALELRHAARGVREAMTDQLWDDVEAALRRAALLRPRASSTRNTATRCRPTTGPIRADLLGNMWAQEWGNIYDVVAPAGRGRHRLRPRRAARRRKAMTPIEDGQDGRGLLHLARLRAAAGDLLDSARCSSSPPTARCICHASAWDVDNVDDLRIKMCIKVNAEDFVDHPPRAGPQLLPARLQRAGLSLSRTARTTASTKRSATSIALSITPEYLVQIGLLDRSKVPSADKDIGLLLRQALDKVAFLPFGLLVDKWRWGVFDGSITPEQYNDGVGGRCSASIRASRRRASAPADAFDPGAKYHIPGNTPYMRYFLARILQFQFYKAACEQAGWTGPLHRCSLLRQQGGRREARRDARNGRVEAVARRARSLHRQPRDRAARRWSNISRRCKTWLDEQNKGKPAGW